MNLPHLIMPLLIAVTVGGILYVVVYPMLSGEAKAEKRITAMRMRTPAKAGGRVNDVAKRRKAVADSLKDLDTRNKGRKPTFEARMMQAGLTWSKTKFYTISAILGGIGAMVTYVISQNVLLTLSMAIVMGLGLPAWIMKRRRNKRIAQFLAELPAAVDIIVRGIKAGIPLSDCIRNIAAEAGEPVKTEFRNIVEAQAMGLTIADAVERLVERVPVAEANFFAIVISIQSKAGGNLAEALQNLSNVLRDRKKMKGKVKAMSSEAKASAGIIGALPPLVASFVYLTSPSYMSLLFVTTTGHIVLGGCVFWMSTGIFIMKKMINFDM